MSTGVGVPEKREHGEVSERHKPPFVGRELFLLADG